MTITDRLAKQKAFRSYLYANRLVRDKSGMMMLDFKHRAGIYGREWAERVWLLCKEIKNETAPQKD